MLHRIVSSFTCRAARTRTGADVIVRAASEHFRSAAYRRLHQMGFRPGGIVDIGAHQGNWTREARYIFKGTPALMIEAREEERPHLRRTCFDFLDVSYTISLLGPEPRDAVKFAISEAGSSIFEEQSDAPRTYREIPIRKLDDVVPDYPKLEPPLFLKLDVQGAAIDVLRGGGNTLGDSEVVQLEVPFLVYNKGAPTAIDVMNFMDAADFVPFDISGFVRPDKISLAQVDILFVRNVSPLRRKFFKISSSSCCGRDLRPGMAVSRGDRTMKVKSITPTNERNGKQPLLISGGAGGATAVALEVEFYDHEPLLVHPAEVIPLSIVSEHTPI
jgi:FkbM family methyltransferase